MGEPDKDNYQLVNVYVRYRPLTKQEIEFRSPIIIHSMSAQEIVLKSDQNDTEKKYRFDRVFGDNVSQNEIYSTVVEPLIDYIISGYNCTVFAYGQTGTGKTHTMVGPEVTGTSINTHNNPSVGIIPRAAAQLFDRLEQLGENVEYTVRVSFTEIYNEDVRDLLTADSLPLRIFDDPNNKGSIYIKDLAERTACNVDEVYEWLHIGLTERQIAATNLNRQSSRSHAIFTLTVHIREISVDGEELLKTAKLHLIDLAGSENIGRSGSTEMRAREAGSINKSLLTLGKVIKALVQKMQHIPYRDSKLTRILQDSLGGNTKTCMIATFSPCANALDETISTLDYASKARSVANCPKVNVNKRQGNVINVVKDKIFELRQELEAARKGDGFYMTQESHIKLAMDLDEKEQRKRFLMEEILRLEDYKETKEREFQECNESFLKTKAFLDKMRQELEEKTAKDREDEHVLNYINGREKELHADAHILLNVCEKSTKCEEIYHAKYQAQCKTTAQNSQTAKDIYSSAVKDLKQMQVSSEYFTNNRDSSLDSLKDSLTSLIKTQCNDLNDLNLNLAEMKDCKATNVDLCEEALIKSSFDNISGLIRNVSSWLNEIILTPLDHLKSTSIERVRQYFAKQEAEISEIGKNVLDTVIEDNKREKEYLEMCKTFLQELNVSATETEDFLYQREKENKKLKYLLLKDLEAINIRHMQLLKEFHRLENMNKEVLTDFLGLEEKKPFEDSEKLLLAYKEHQANSVKDAGSVITEAIAKSEEHVKQGRLQVEEEKNKTELHLSEGYQSMENNLARLNAEQKEYLMDWYCKTQSSKENLADNSTVVADLKKEFQQFSKISIVYDYDLKKFVHQSTQNISRLEADVTRNAHVGDTPIKETYKYPQNIEKRVSDEALVEKFKMDEQQK